LDWPMDSTDEGKDCWVKGYDSGFAGKYDKDRADRCAQENDEYNRSWGYACRDGGFTENECNDFKNNPVDLDHETLQEENRRACYDDGYEDGRNSNSFDKDRDSGCSEYSSSYETGFSAGCQSVEGNTNDSCELIIEGQERYCPNNPDDPACTEFLHDASNKQPPEGGICALPQQERTFTGCFKDQDPEKYCLNHNDPAFCKTIGDICDADGFVKPEDAYCTID
ncbi:MAG TPA: hypothetical protein VD694_04540, partial [Nitrososphaeraceae archaeon]|nr:hypothetical protein [Nitrososphaeraceae archaeon]